ncbi:hypothetical protein HJG60_006599 [Phyllostomus discolor]|uniref:Interferon lambda-4-like n=1 Tax=Phyllostomus discolor TaxID=89673 RepID=A0A834DFD3_9CHIR|nr:hypothetical protein HJG60_006599 [Phyllostomus discolor]
MRPCGVAAVFMGLWAFVTLSVAADGGVAEPRRCLLSHYRWLDPRALVSIKALRDHYTCARLRLVARDLSDAQAVLSSLPSPELFPGVIPTLELLAAARRDVVACDSPRCHEASVIFNLLRLLTWDLKLVAHSGPCL